MFVLLTNTSYSFLLHPVKELTATRVVSLAGGNKIIKGSNVPCPRKCVRKFRAQILSIPRAGAQQEEGL